MIKPWPVLTVLAALLVVAGNSGAANGLVLEFASPAQLSGDSQVEHGEWALLIFGPESISGFDIRAASQELVNYTRVYTHTVTNQSDFDKGVDFQPEKMAVPADLEIALRYAGAWASLLIHADTIRLDASASLELLAAVNRAESQSLPSKAYPRDAIRQDGLNPPDGVVASYQPPSGDAWSFSVRAEGLRRIEWHNATTDCDFVPCPDGGRSASTRYGLPGMAWTQFDQRSFLDLRANGGELRGAGTAYLAAVGGHSLNLMIDGHARFPEASLAGSCGKKNCQNPAGRTLLLDGEMNLAGLNRHPERRGRVVTNLDAQLEGAAFDETPVRDLVERYAVVGTAAALGTAVLVKLLVALFARNNRPLLDHPTAKLLHDLVLNNPGLSFGQIREKTALAHGTTQYHLLRLRKAGLVVAHKYRNTIRYYENHGRHKDDWHPRAALQRLELRQLHEWIVEHPRSSQSQVIAAARKWGWTRSTTQDRLRQLLEAQLLLDHRTPLGVEYTARLLRSQSAPTSTVADVREKVAEV